jgi:hypothetical protein
VIEREKPVTGVLGFGAWGVPDSLLACQVLPEFQLARLGALPASDSERGLVQEHR